MATSGLSAAASASGLIAVGFLLVGLMMGGGAVYILSPRIPPIQPTPAPSPAPVTDVPVVVTDNPPGSEA